MLRSALQVLASVPSRLAVNILNLLTLAHKGRGGADTQTHEWLAFELGNGRRLEPQMRLCQAPQIYPSVWGRTLRCRTVGKMRRRRKTTSKLSPTFHLRGFMYSLAPHKMCRCSASRWRSCSWCIAVNILGAAGLGEKYKVEDKVLTTPRGPTFL